MSMSPVAWVINYSVCHEGIKRLIIRRESQVFITLPTTTNTTLKNMMALLRYVNIILVIDFITGHLLTTLVTILLVATKVYSHL